MISVRTILAPFCALLLTGCLLLPGAFEAEMRVNANGAFDFAYRGQILIGNDDNRNPDVQPGKSDDTEQPDFMAAEFEDAIAAFTGGLNFNDEATIVAFAEELEARRGWNSVAYRGEGMFDVDYASSGRLDQDFLFPVVPDFILNFPIVAAVPRDDGTVRIVISALMPEPDDDNQVETERLETIGEGTFTLITTAPIVSTNGTVSEGDNPGEMVIRWSSDVPSNDRPEAVIRPTP